MHSPYRLCRTLGTHRRHGLDREPADRSHRGVRLRHTKHIRRDNSFRAPVKINAFNTDSLTTVRTAELHRVGLLPDESFGRFKHLRTPPETSVCRYSGTPVVH